jgi:hypothetical protein
MNELVSYIKSGIRAVLPAGLKQRIGFQRALRKSDVFLVGHPKSGNTWLAYMLAILANEDREKRINMANVGDFVPTIHNGDYRIAHYPHLPDPRIFRNEATRYPALYPRTIYIVRDPRAALLSYYHHCVHDSGRTDWPITNFVDEMIAEGRIASLEPTLVRWDRQVEAWMARAERQAVCLVKYEDLKRDCRTTLEKLADFVGFERDEEILQVAVERGDFSNMRKEEKTYGAESYPGEKGEKGFFVRKGTIDSWKEEMPTEAIEKIEKAFHPVMKQLGYVE